MDKDVLYNEDCLEGMKRIPDGAVDMILVDPPFGSTDNDWDKRLPMEPMWAEFKRVTIKTYTNDGELVLDACMGSGSTAVAAIRCGRHFIGFETHAPYCEVAARRIEEAREWREQHAWETARAESATSASRIAVRTTEPAPTPRAVQMCSSMAYERTGSATSAGAIAPMEALFDLPGAARACMSTGAP